MFLASKEKSVYVLSIFLHCDPYAGCLNIESCLHSSLCHRINLALSLFLNRRSKRGIIGEYHMTLAGTLPLDVPRIIFSDLVTQCTAYGANIQILVVTSVENAVTGTCMYLLHLKSQRANKLFHFVRCARHFVVLRKHFFKSFSNSPNPLSDTSCLAFHCSNSSVVPSFFNPSSQPGYNN